MGAHLFVSWWWRMQRFSFFCKSWNTSSEIWVCLSEYSCLPQSCSFFTCVCLISSSAALSFSSWLQATHSSVAYRLGKANPVDKPKKPANTCVRKKFTLYWFKEIFSSVRQGIILDFIKSALSIRKLFWMVNSLAFKTWNPSLL
jgi:hypothetical protein